MCDHFGDNMRELSFIAELPNVPAVYALYGGHKRRLYVAYVGIADKLKRRMIQHLVNRDSSIATGMSAVGINPDYVTEVRWWEHPQFGERHVLEAAELVAFDVLDPALRSRGHIHSQARRLYADPKFNREMTLLFSSDQEGRLVLPTLQHALERIAQVERRIEVLETKLVIEQ